MGIATSVQWDVGVVYNISLLILQLIFRIFQSVNQVPIYPAACRENVANMVKIEASPYGWPWKIQPREIGLIVKRLVDKLLLG